MDQVFKRFLIFLILSPLWAFLFDFFEFNFSFYDVISIVIIIFYIIKYFKKKLYISRLYYLLILYLIIISFPIFTNQKGYTQLLNVLATFSLLIIIENIYFSDKLIKTVLYSFKITILISLLISVIQFINPEFFVSKMFINENDIQSIYLARRPSIYSFLNPNDLGLSFLPIFSLFLNYELKNKKRTFIIWIIIGGLICILSNSRYIILGFFLIVILLLYHYGKINISKVLIWITRLSIIFLVLFFILKSLGYDFQEYFEERIFVEGDFKNSSRYLAFEAFNNFFSENPWFGTGQHLTPEIESFLGNKSSQIHVGYLSHLVTYGIIGSIPLFLFWILFAKKLFKLSKYTGFYGSYISFIIFLWANVSFVRYSMISYGLIFAYVFSQYAYQQIWFQRNNNIQNTT